MGQSLKEKWAAALAEAQKEADALGEDEVNARLGPATRRFFDATEKMEGSAQRLFDGVGGATLAVMGMAIAGWVVGVIVSLHLLPLAGLVAMASAIAVFTFWATAAARRRGGDIPYLAGLAGFLTCSAASSGTEDGAAVGLAFLAGVGLAQICVRRAGHATDQAPVDTSDQPLAHSPTPVATEHPPTALAKGPGAAQEGGLGPTDGEAPTKD
jgi:hypothetical protein